MHIAIAEVYIWEKQLLQRIAQGKHRSQSSLVVEDSLLTEYLRNEVAIQPMIIEIFQIAY